MSARFHGRQTRFQEPSKINGVRPLLSVMKFPAVDWRSEMKKAIHQKVAEVIEDGRYGQSHPVVQEFEKAFAGRMGVSHAMAVSSATSGLHAAMVALGIRPGDEVLVPTITFFSVVHAVVHAGSIPVYVDVDPFTWNMDPHDTAKKVTRNTKALIAAHLFGVPCDMEALMKVAKRHKLKVIEDAAQSLLAVERGRTVGTIGDAGIFSFQQVKHLNAGEGGMVVTRDRAVAERVRKFAHLKKGASLPLSYNYRMTAFQAAVGLAQMPYLQELVSARVRQALVIRSKLSELPWATAQWVPSWVESAHFRVGISVQGIKPAAAETAMRRLGWKAKPWHPPVHREAGLKGVGRGKCPVADRIRRSLWTVETGGGPSK